MHSSERVACLQQGKTIDAPSLITKTREHERIFEFIRVSLFGVDLKAGRFKS